MCENTQGKTSKGMGKGRRKQARQWRQEDKLQNIGLWKKKITFCGYFAGQASERVSLVVRASEEENTRHQEMDTD